MSVILRAGETVAPPGPGAGGAIVILFVVISGRAGAAQHRSSSVAVYTKNISIQALHCSDISELLHHRFTDLRSGHSLSTGTFLLSIL